MLLHVKCKKCKFFSKLCKLVVSECVNFAAKSKTVPGKLQVNVKL